MLFYEVQSNFFQELYQWINRYSSILSLFSNQTYYCHFSHLKKEQLQSSFLFIDYLGLTLPFNCSFFQSSANQHPYVLVEFDEVHFKHHSSKVMQLIQIQVVSCKSVSSLYPVWLITRAVKRSFVGQRFSDICFFFNVNQVP